MGKERDQVLRFVIKPLLIPEEEIDDRHRCANYVVVKIVFEKAQLNQCIDKYVGSLFTPA